MPVDPDKRRMRQDKRAIKKAGNKHRRQSLKRQLEQNPEEAAHADEDLGRHTSKDFNGMDHDSKRQQLEKDDDRNDDSGDQRSTKKS
jgi:hypothetical protein